MLFKIANRGSEMLGNVKTVASLEAVINLLRVCVMIQFFSYIAVWSLSTGFSAQDNCFNE